MAAKNVFHFIIFGSNYLICGKATDHYSTHSFYSEILKEGFNRSSPSRAFVVTQASQMLFSLAVCF